MPASWLGRSLLDPGDQHWLEQESAVNEFVRKMDRPKAEAKAYEAYRKGIHEKAAGHHLAQLNAAKAVGDNEAAAKAGILFERHARAAGRDPAASAEWARLHMPQHKLQEHPADALLGEPS